MPVWLLAAGVLAADTAQNKRPLERLDLMTCPGIDEIVFSTFDLERGCAALVSVGDFRRVDLPDCPPEQFAAWRVPHGCTRIQQAMLSAPGDDRGRLRVVVFHGAEQELIRPSQRSWDTGGIFDIDLFSRDVRGVYRRLQREHGWTAFGEPVDYEMGEFDVTQVVAKGPDGLVLAIIQPHKPPSFELPEFNAMSRAFNSTQLVRSLDDALAFYCDTLGWKALMQHDVSGVEEPGKSTLGLPMPAAKSWLRRVAIVHPLGVNDGSVELIEIGSVEGCHYGERAVAPNVGILALRIAMPSARAYAAELSAKGVELYAPPSTVEIAPFGPMDCFSVRSPDGAILEFISPAEPDAASKG